MSAFYSALVATTIVSLLSLLGVLTIPFRDKHVRKVVPFLVYLAVGSLFGDSFIHLLPQAYAKISSTLIAALGVILGLLLFFILEKLLSWRHHHDLTDTSHPHHKETPGIEPYAYVVLAGDGLHNFIDGLLIAASYIISPALGLATTIAVVAHEIPEELSHFAILIHTGMNKTQALLWNFISALTAILGALVPFLLINTNESFINFLLPVTAGGFIYIAGTDLLPELKTHIRLQDTALQMTAIILGVGIMVILFFLE